MAKGLAALARMVARVRATHEKQGEKIDTLEEDLDELQAAERKRERAVVKPKKGRRVEGDAEREPEGDEDDGDEDDADDNDD
jgi:hypothetical protein